MQSLPRVLIIEDDPAIRALLVAALKREPVIVETAADGLAALDHMRNARFAIVLLDLMMPRMNGIDFLAAYPAVTSSQPIVIVMTAFDRGRAAQLITDNAHAIIHKPFDLDHLAEMVRDTAVAYAAAHTDEVVPPRALFES